MPFKMAAAIAFGAVVGRIDGMLGRLLRLRTDVRTAWHPNGADVKLRADFAHQTKARDSKMNSELPIRLVLVDPPSHVDFGIQRGRGAHYEPMFVQQRKRGDVSFDFSLTAADNRTDGLPNFLGPFVQGPPSKRFVYIDVGTYAGQKDTQWARRMIVPLGGITWTLIDKVLRKSGQRLSARVPGTGKDGGPNCATVHLLGDWQVITDDRE
jgi:Family of unknown function (DUF5990)